jgi:ribosomal protein S18 acetylase RimI-like enzyme
VIRIRERRGGDVDGCVAALTLVHQRDPYPTNWPADPAGWLTPAAMVAGWVAVDDEETVVGHVILQGGSADEVGVVYVSRLFVTPGSRGGIGSRLLDHAREWAAAGSLDLALEVVDHEDSAAIALYERNGWRRVRTAPAHWTAPDGGVVLVHHYVLGETTNQRAQ